MVLPLINEGGLYGSVEKLNSITKVQVSDTRDFEQNY